MPKHTSNDSEYKACTSGDQCVHPEGPCLPATEQYFYVTSNGYTRGKCKECSKAYRRKHHQDNREHDNERSRKYVEENKDKVYAYNREWSKANKDHALKYERERYNNNPDVRKRRLKRVKNWRKNNPEKARALDQRNRARRENAEGELTPEDIRIIYERQRGKCYWCLKPVGDDYQVDHRIPIARGGKNTPGNVVISCQFCNQSKGAKLPHEWNGRLL